MFDTPKIFCKEFREKVVLKKKSADDSRSITITKHAKK